jgi:hypothetical protein
LRLVDSIHFNFLGSLWLSGIGHVPDHESPFDGPVERLPKHAMMMDHRLSRQTTFATVLPTVLRCGRVVRWT